jgi:hypothetical protein
MERQAAITVIEDLLDLKGATVLDVGCGNGWLTRLLTERGAHVTGIEISPRQLLLARNIQPVGDEHYLQGSAEELPFPNRSADIVIFLNSLHHIDEKALAKAMRESARVLKHGGVLYVAEPFAAGDYFELMRPVHDETIARRRAQEILRHAPEWGLLLEKTLTYLDQSFFPDFEAFSDRLTTINPEIRNRVAEEEPSLREAFARLGRKTDGGWSFDQPYRAALLRRT